MPLVDRHVDLGGGLDLGGGDGGDGGVGGGDLVGAALDSRVDTGENVSKSQKKSQYKLEKGYENVTFRGKTVTKMSLLKENSHKKVTFKEQCHFKMSLLKHKNSHF